ncbi:MAG: glutamate--cysteine ligase [Alphaproteobacteria bacterium]|nr:glutamate--cysteine ligase [Alphaproteobacteria bacterium]
MSGPATTATTPVESRRDLVTYMAEGCKPERDWRIGTEHEKFGFTNEDLRPLPHGGARGIRAMLEGMQRFGWEPFFEGENLIALTKDGGAISLEPGGQFELSGAPVETLHETCQEVHTHLKEVRAVADELGVSFLGLGFQPKWRLDEIPVMPKGRYGIMRAYMPKKGRRGLEMMFRTCTVQVNLDFASEADMVQKFRVALALQPIATALFANSPFTEGKPNGYLSYRSAIWLDTDPDRTGMLPFAFEDGMGFERYADYALDVPMYFVIRDGRYVDCSGQSFRDFLAGRLPALPGERPTLRDWSDHLTTLFPEARVKRYMETRGADAGPWQSLCALPALWVGLLYDRIALDEAWQLCKEWTVAERQALREVVPVRALNAEIQGRRVQDVAREVLAIAGRGLARRRRLNAKGRDESLFLEPVVEIAESGRTAAEVLLQAYRERWGGSIDPVFSENAY